ncbi:MAG: hypothetical protein GY710_01590 [Desulfobacteraceae bacterium]|nr:hypothetical protein [Desulfobacteraceae bacterium]
MNKPSVRVTVEKWVNKKGVTYVMQAIAYANDHSRKATWQSYKAYLGKTLDQGWGDGYASDGGNVADLAGKWIYYAEAWRQADEKGNLYVGNRTIPAAKLADLIAAGKAEVKDAV